jgi:hypothetical protein
MKQFVDVTDVHDSKCSMRAGFAICLVRARNRDSEQKVRKA